MQAWCPRWECPLEEGMVIHSRILAWRISWMEEPDGLQSIGSQRVGRGWGDSMHAAHTPLGLQPCQTAYANNLTEGTLGPRGMPLWQNPNNNPGPQNSGELPFLAILRVHCHTLMPWEFSVHVTPLGVDDWKLMPGLSKDSSYDPFSVVDFSLDPFTVTGPSRDYNSFADFCKPF